MDQAENRTKILKIVKIKDISTRIAQIILLQNDVKFFGTPCTSIKGLVPS